MATAGDVDVECLWSLLDHVFEGIARREALAANVVITPEHYALGGSF